MKIGIDISQIAFPGTGVATYTKNLVAQLLKIDTRNQYVLFASSLRQQQAFKDFPAKVFPFPPTLTEFIWNQLHIFPIENLIGKVDVFHSSDWTQPPTKAKKVTTIHDMIVYKFPESSHSKIIATQKRRLEWVKKECDLIIADSQATKKDIIEILRVPENKIKVVYLAAGEEFRPQSEDEINRVKQKYHLEKSYVLAVGTREPRKNLDRVAEAFSKLKSKNVELVIAGKSGWGNDNFIRQTGGSNLKLLGYVPQEDLPAHFAGAACFVYPSLYEGFGVPILEAMACGCPVVTSNVSSLPEVGGKAALYVDPTSLDDIADKIDSAIRSRDNLTKVGLAQAKKFSWKKTAQETLNIYEELA